MYNFLNISINWENCLYVFCFLTLSGNGTDGIYGFIGSFFIDSGSGAASSFGWRISHSDGGSAVFWIELSSHFLDSSWFPSVALFRLFASVFCNCCSFHSSMWLHLFPWILLDIAWQRSLWPISYCISHLAHLNFKSMYGCCGALLKLCYTIYQLSYYFFSFLFLLSLLLLALLLLLRLKVSPHDVLLLKIWVVLPSWIICVRVGVVLSLIIIDIIRLLSLLEDKTIKLTRIAFMPPPQKSQELVWMKVTVVVPNRFVIITNCAWIADTVSKLMYSWIIFAVPLDDCHW